MLVIPAMFLTDAELLEVACRARDAGERELALRCWGVLATRFARTEAVRQEAVSGG